MKASVEERLVALICFLAMAGLLASVYFGAQVTP